MSYIHILITGGTGFVGKYLVQALLQMGHTVTLLRHNSTFENEIISELIEIYSWGALKNNAKIDAIFNLEDARISKRWTSQYI